MCTIRSRITTPPRKASDQRIFFQLGYSLGQGIDNSNLGTVECSKREYEVLPENMYNMDEKGFMIGVTGRSKRIFSKTAWEKKKKRQNQSKMSP
jgi:hypothetical protein